MKSKELRNVIKKITTDPGFRKKLKADLKEVLKKEKILVDENSLNVLKKHIYATDDILLAEAAGPGRVVATVGTSVSIVAATSTMHRSNHDTEDSKKKNIKDSSSSSVYEDTAKLQSRPLKW